MDLQDLTDVHTRRHTQRIQYDIQRTAIWQERHILYRKYAGNDTLVTMTSCPLITYRNLTFLGNVNADSLVYARSQLVAVLSGKYFCVDDDAVSTVRYF